MQTKTESMIETTLNISSGFVISLIFWSLVIVPLYDLPVTQSQNLSITLMFTVVAVIRSYIWRRIFSNGIHKKIHKLFSNGV
jgi:hypothetical protein